MLCYYFISQIICTLDATNWFLTKYFFVEINQLKLKLQLIVFFLIFFLIKNNFFLCNIYVCLRSVCLIMRRNVFSRNENEISNMFEANMYT